MKELTSIIFSKVVPKVPSERGTAYELHKDTICKCLVIDSLYDFNYKNKLSDLVNSIIHVSIHRELNDAIQRGIKDNIQEKING